MVNGSFRGPKERRSFKPKVAGSTPVGRILFIPAYRLRFGSIGAIAARRIVPIVEPLLRRLRDEWIRQGQPGTGKVCPPRARSESGLLDLSGLSKRVAQSWQEVGFAPVGLQDSRHTAATWLDHAGVAPKVASVFMGHKAPGRHLHPGAAPITLRRYTHVLAGELDRTREQLDQFLASREAEEAEPSTTLSLVAETGA